MIDVVDALIDAVICAVICAGGPGGCRRTRSTTHATRARMGFEPGHVASVHNAFTPVEILSWS